MQSLWMLLACVMFAIMGACIKVSAELDANLAQIVLFRGLPSIIFILCGLGYVNAPAAAQLKAHVLRNILA